MALLVAGAAFHGPLEREPLRHVLQPREPFTATAQAVLLLAFLCTPWPRPSPAAEPFAVLPLLFRFGAAAGAAGPWRLGAQSRHMLGSRFFAVFYPLCLWARLLARLWSSCWAAGLCLVVLAQDSIACRPANDRLLSLSVVPSQCRVPAAAATPARPTTKGDINGLPVLIKPVVKLSIFGISQASAIPAEHAESRTFGRARSLRPTGDR